MYLTLLKSKIHMARVTSAEVEYIGSIAICPKLLKASGIMVNEKVHVLNFENGARFETYVIEGKEQEIGLRGPAARLAKLGDRVIILTYAMFEKKEASSHKPTVIFVDEKNQVQK